MPDKPLPPHAAPGGPLKGPEERPDGSGLDPEEGGGRPLVDTLAERRRWNTLIGAIDPRRIVAFTEEILYVFAEGDPPVHRARLPGPNSSPEVLLRAFFRELQSVRHGMPIPEVEWKRLESLARPMIPVIRRPLTTLSLDGDRVAVVLRLYGKVGLVIDDDEDAPRRFARELYGTSALPLWWLHVKTLEEGLKLLSQLHSALLEDGAGLALILLDRMLPIRENTRGQRDWPRLSQQKHPRDLEAQQICKQTLTVLRKLKEAPIGEGRARTFYVTSHPLPPEELRSNDAALTHLGLGGQNSQWLRRSDFPLFRMMLTPQRSRALTPAYLSFGPEDSLFYRDVGTDALNAGSINLRHVWRESLTRISQDLTKHESGVFLIAGEGMVERTTADSSGFPPQSVLLEEAARMTLTQLAREKGYWQATLHHDALKQTWIRELKAIHPGSDRGEEGSHGSTNLRPWQRLLDGFAMEGMVDLEGIIAGGAPGTDSATRDPSAAGSAGQAPASMRPREGTAESSVDPLDPIELLFEGYEDMRRAMEEDHASVAYRAQASGAAIGPPSGVRPIAGRIRRWDEIRRAFLECYRFILSTHDHGVTYPHWQAQRLSFTGVVSTSWDAQFERAAQLVASRAEGLPQARASAERGRHWRPEDPLDPTDRSSPARLYKPYDLESTHLDREMPTLAVKRSRLELTRGFLAQRSRGLSHVTLVVVGLNLRTHPMTNVLRSFQADWCQRGRTFSLYWVTPKAYEHAAQLYPLAMERRLTPRERDLQSLLAIDLTSPLEPPVQSLLSCRALDFFYDLWGVHLARRG